MSNGKDNQKLLERVLKSGGLVLTVCVDTTCVIDGIMAKPCWMMSLRSGDNYSITPNAEGAGTTYKQALNELCLDIKEWVDYEEDYGHR